MTRRRYVALDGLRGVAAFAVIAYHAGRMITHAEIAPHGYLAVDFFFVLSGFVIGAAYEDKMNSGELGPVRFLARVRAVRLYPMLLVALALSMALIAARVDHLDGFSPKMALQDALLLPALKSRSALYPLDGVQWSLALEVLANAAHVLILRRLSVSALAAIALVSGVALTFLGYPRLTTDLGAIGPTALGGLARISFAYPIGLIIYRLHRGGRLQGVEGGWWMAALLLAASVCVPTERYTLVGYAHDLAATFLVMPLTVGLALQPIHRPLINRIAEFSGGASYPLYITQGPLIGMFIFAARSQGEVARSATAAAFALTAVLLAWALNRYVDQPFGKAASRWLSEPHRTPAFTAP